MNLGIVGSEAAKFTAETEAKARKEINDLFDRYKPVRVVSGGCHLGGIDIWAKEEAGKRGLEFLELAPDVLQWDPPHRVGYKARNEGISRESDVVACITVATLPVGYSGMRFSRCYHCNSDDHVKSGGCWTVKHARRAGKSGLVIVIR